MLYNKNRQRNKSMAKITLNMTPEAELLQSQENAIRQYQLCESEKLGFDIGRERAAREWFDKVFPEWVKAERLAIDQLLAKSSSLPGRAATVPSAPRPDRAGRFPQLPFLSTLT